MFLKKFFYIFTTLLLSFILSGCGSGDADGKIPPAETTLKVYTTDFTTDSSQNSGNMTLRFDAAVSSGINLELKDFKLVSDKYDINITSIIPSISIADGESKDITIYFTYRPKSLEVTTPTLEDIDLSYTKVLHSTLSTSVVTESAIVSLETVATTTDSTTTTDSNISNSSEETSNTVTSNYGPASQIS